MSENNKEIEEIIDQKIKNRLDLDVKKEVEELLQKDFAAQKLSAKIKRNVSDNIGLRNADNSSPNVKENYRNSFSNKKTNNQDFENQDQNEEEAAADQLERDKKKSSLDGQKKENKIQDKNRKGPEMDSRTTPIRENPTKKPERDENIKKESLESSLDNLNKNNKSGSSESKKEAQLSADKNKDKSAKISSSSGASSESISGIEKFTTAIDELLKASWENLIDSFGLTLLYIYFHWFMHQLFPRFFCDLGKEWVPAEVKQASPDAAKAMGKKIGLVEKGLVGWTCLIILVSLLQTTIIIYLVLNAYSIIIDAAWSWVKGIFG
ncbi:MAG TPA: hypothetical protein PK142_01570 [bacterium]|nr:hypothetical protein [bacterium]